MACLEADRLTMIVVMSTISTASRRQRQPRGWADRCRFSQPSGLHFGKALLNGLYVAIIYMVILNNHLQHVTFHKRHAANAKLLCSPPW